jgi:hypothetical protein
MARRGYPPVVPEGGSSEEPSATLSRRALLGRAGALAFGPSVLAPLADALAGPSPGPGGLHKCLSLAGPGPPENGGHPNDFRIWGNREFVRASRTEWVKMTLSWAALQPTDAPRSREAAWLDLNMAPGGEAWLSDLDRAVRAANDDGVRVIVTLHHAFPLWSNARPGPDPDSERLPEQQMPDDLSPDGPWGWFVGYLCARYRGGMNPLGPHEPIAGEGTGGYDPRSGNPMGARIDALEICNEPNTLYWPQREAPRRVAEMIRSAEELSHRHAGPAILAPSTADSPDPEDSSDPRRETDWRSFSQRVLAELRDFRPRVPVGWAQHNYRDVKRETSADKSRAQHVIALLHDVGWPGLDQRLWLTEGGYNLGAGFRDPDAKDEQARKIEKSVEEMRRVPEVCLWTQHTVNDIGTNDFHAGLRDAFRYGSAAGPGAPRPAYEAWKRV